MSRLKKLTHALVSGYLHIGVTAVYSIASISLALSYLSTAEFGVWQVVAAVAGYLSLIDFGMTASLGPHDRLLYAKFLRCIVADDSDSMLRRLSPRAPREWRRELVWEKPLKIRGDGTSLGQKKAKSTFSRRLQELQPVISSARKR